MTNLEKFIAKTPPETLIEYITKDSVVNYIMKELTVCNYCVYSHDDCIKQKCKDGIEKYLDINENINSELLEDLKMEQKECM